MADEVISREVDILGKLCFLVEPYKNWFFTMLVIHSVSLGRLYLDFNVLRSNGKKCTVF